MKKLIVILAFSLTACSNQWLEGDAGYSGEDVNKMLSEAGGASSSSMGGEVATVQSYASTDGSVIYFADNSGSLGPTASVLAFDDLSVFGLAGVYPWELQQARVFFVDSTSGYGLILALDTGSGFQSYAFTGTGGVSGGVFQATLTGNGQTVVIQSDDATDGVLNDVIQLRVYDQNGDFIGKFSTLVGYYN